MSDTNNEVNTPAENAVVAPTPEVASEPVSVPTPAPEPVASVAPAVSDVPTPAEPAVVPPVAISTPTPAPAVAPTPVTTTPASVAEQPVPAVSAKDAELAKTEIEENSNLYSGSVESKSIDSISSDLAVPDDTNTEKTKKEVSGQSSSGEQIIDDKENKKLPIVVLLIFLLLLIVIVIYYFIVMTPTKVFDKAIDNIFDTVTGVVDNVRNNKSDTIVLSMGVDMETDGDINEYLDGIKFRAGIEADLKKLEMGLNIASQSGETKIKAADNFDSKVYVKDGGIYVSNERLERTYPGQVALYSDSGLTDVSYNRIDNAIDVIERTKNEIVDIIENEQLRRTIAIKKVNNQTTIALKASCTLDNKEIADIYKPIFKKYLKDEKFIKQVSEIIGTMSEEEVKDEIQRLYDRDVVTQKIDVNLYMNLANTQLISLDVTVDDYFVKIDNLNGYFYGMVKYAGAKHSFDEPEFIIQFEYDANKGLLNGTGKIDKPGQTNIYSEFDYTRVEKDGKKVGNILHINFFNKVVSNESERNDKKNIIAKLDCRLDIDDDNPTINLLGKANEVNKNEEVQEGIDESMHRLTHYVDYVFRTLLYSLWDDDKYAQEMYKRAVENRVEKAIKNNETPITIDDIKEEAAKAKAYCNKSGTYTYLYNGASKTTGEFDGFPELDEPTFDWICLYGRLTEEEEDELNFDYVDDIDFDYYEDAIAAKKGDTAPSTAKKKANVDIEEISVSPEEKELKVGEKIKILNAYEPNDATKTKLTWKSSDNKVATVDNKGEVTAVSKGTAKITVTSESNKTATATITVVEE